MFIGGILLGAGMVLDLRPGEYRSCTGDLQFLHQHVVDTLHEDGEDWVILSGLQRPTAVNPWRPRIIRVRVAALRGTLRPELS